MPIPDLPPIALSPEGLSDGLAHTISTKLNWIGTVGVSDGDTVVGRHALAQDLMALEHRKPVIAALIELGQASLDGRE